MPSKEEVQVTEHPAGKLLKKNIFAYVRDVQCAPCCTGARSRCPKIDRMREIVFRFGTQKDLSSD